MTRIRVARTQIVLIVSCLVVYLFCASAGRGAGHPRGGPPLPSRPLRTSPLLRLPPGSAGHRQGAQAHASKCVSAPRTANAASPAAHRPHLRQCYSLFPRRCFARSVVCASCCRRCVRSTAGPLTRQRRLTVPCLVASRALPDGATAIRIAHCVGRKGGNERLTCVVHATKRHRASTEGASTGGTHQRLGRG